MAFERVGAREVIPALVAEGDLERVRLRGVTTRLEILPRRQLGVGAEPAVDLNIYCPVVLGSREQCPVLQLELYWDLEVLVLCSLLLFCRCCWRRTVLLMWCPASTSTLPSAEIGCPSAVSTANPR